MLLLVFFSRMVSGCGVGVGWGALLKVQSLFSEASDAARPPLLVQCWWLCFVCCDSADVSPAQPFAFCAPVFSIVFFCSVRCCCCFVFFSFFSPFLTAGPLQSPASLLQRFR